MPDFILYLAMSLDGYIARPDGRVDWLPTPEAGGEDYGYAEFYNSIDALVMGATTYEQVLEFGEWPYPGKHAYILTSRPLSTDRDDIVLVKDGFDQLMQSVRQAGHRRVWIVGGRQLISALMARQGVDEHLIAIIPILLGAGIPLYDAVPEQALTLLSGQIYPSGVVVLHYGQPRSS